MRQKCGFLHLITDFKSFLLTIYIYIYQVVPGTRRGGSFENRTWLIWNSLLIGILGELEKVNELKINNLTWHEMKGKWVNEWMNAWMHECMNAWMHEWMDGWMDGWNEGMKEWRKGMKEWRNEGRKEGRNEWMDGWMNEWIMNEWLTARIQKRKNARMNEWMNKWMNKWISCTFFRPHLPKVLRPWEFFAILYFYVKSSSRYRLVHFLSISSCKSAATFTVSYNIFQVEIELSLQSCALFVDNFDRSSRETAQTETFGDHGWPFYSKKHGASCPRVFSSLSSRVPDLLNTSQLLDDDVVDMMIEMMMWLPW